MDGRSAGQVSFLSTKQLLRKGIAATEDSPTAAALRRAGGIPLAVTNVSELCMWMEAANPVYGRTYNPYHTGRTAGGSSGGEGALIGAAGSPFGIGSDVGGSIRYVHVRLDKSRIIWQNNLGCRHSSMGSLVTNQARVLWITVAGFPWPQAQSKSKTMVTFQYPSATCAPDLWHATPPTCSPCCKFWQKTMLHSFSWRVKLTWAN